MEIGEGRDAIENAFKRRYFSQLLQVSVRAKLDTYNGEIRMTMHFKTSQNRITTH